MRSFHIKLVLFLCICGVVAAQRLTNQYSSYPNNRYRNSRTPRPSNNRQNSNTVSSGTTQRTPTQSQILNTPRKYLVDEFYDFVRNMTKDMAGMNFDSKLREYRQDFCIKARLLYASLDYFHTHDRPQAVVKNLIIPTQSQLDQVFHDILGHIQNVDMDNDGRADNKSIFVKGKRINVGKSAHETISITGQDIQLKGDDCFISGTNIRFTGKFGVLIGNNIQGEGDNIMVIGNNITHKGANIWTLREYTINAFKH